MAEAPHIGECRVLGHLDRQAAEIKFRRQSCCTGKLAVHGKYDMAIASTEGTGECGEPDLLPADREAGEDVKEQRHPPVHRPCLVLATPPI
jgi:hypothetical protein